MNAADLASALAVSLLLTVAIETGFFFLVGKRNKKDAALVILVNMITNPAVVLIYWIASYYMRMDGGITGIMRMDGGIASIAGMGGGITGIMRMDGGIAGIMRMDGGIAGIAGIAGIMKAIVKIALEVIAIITEGYYYKRYGQDFRHPFVFSTAANAVSFGTGLLIHAL